MREEEKERKKEGGKKGNRIKPATCKTKEERRENKWRKTPNRNKGKKKESKVEEG